LIIIEQQLNYFQY